MSDEIKHSSTEEQSPDAPSAQVDSPAKKPNKQPSKRRETYRGILSTILILVLAPVIAFLLTAFVFQSYQVDGPSMQPTLHNNDRLIVVKYPRTWARITGNPYVPNRGDIIIFNKSGLYDSTNDKPKQLVKRVIGLPGDHLIIQNGKVTIYNDKHPDGFTPAKTLPYGKVIGTTTAPTIINIKIPKDEIFVMGDNRSNSLDSRYFGPIPLDSIIGKLDIRVYPNPRTF